jgi:hypothetical protein
MRQIMAGIHMRKEELAREEAGMPGNISAFEEEEKELLLDFATVTRQLSLYEVSLQSDQLHLFQQSQTKRKRLYLQLHPE